MKNLAAFIAHILFFYILLVILGLIVWLSISFLNFNLKIAAVVIIAFVSALTSSKIIPHMMVVNKNTGFIVAIWGVVFGLLFIFANRDNADVLGILLTLIGYFCGTLFMKPSILKENK